jgi:hypothetical protein
MTGEAKWRTDAILGTETQAQQKIPMFLYLDSRAGRLVRIVFALSAMAFAMCFVVASTL